MTVMPGLLTVLLALALALVPARAARAQTEGEVGPTPPRLSYVAGEVSFWREGAEDWAAAQLNTPLAPGDELYSAHGGTLETQIGAGALRRAWGDSLIDLTVRG